jgi:AraC family transcriptional regulator
MHGLSDPFINNLVELLSDTRQAGMPITRLHAESTAVVLIHRLSELARDGQCEVARHRAFLPNARLANVVECINENLASDLSVFSLAKIAHMSGSHFARSFKATVGMTPHAYVLQERVERAKTLIAGGRVSMVQVAFECGFLSQSHLTTVFHRATGITPGAYCRSSRAPLKRQQKSTKEQAEM